MRRCVSAAAAAAAAVLPGTAICFCHLAYGELLLPQFGATGVIQLGWSVEDDRAERQKETGLDEGQEWINLCWVVELGLCVEML